MSRNGTVLAGRPHSPRASTRSTGREVRVLVWLCRHPLITVVPAAVVAACVWWGARPVAATVAGLSPGCSGGGAGTRRRSTRRAA